MSEEIRGRRTKDALERALRELLKTRPLEDIRVRELTEACMIRRQSFYYHFTDIYDLFDWSLRREAAALMERQELCLHWRQALEDLLAHVGAEEDYYRALLASRGRTGLREVLWPALEQLAAQSLTWYRLRCAIPEEGAAGQAQSVAETALALVEGWVSGGVRQPPQELLDRAEEAVRCAVLGAAMRNLSRQTGAEG